MVAPLAKEDLEIEVSGGAEKKPFVQLTQELMYRFGQPQQELTSLEGDRVLLKVKPGVPYRIPDNVHEWKLSGDAQSLESEKWLRWFGSVCSSGIV